MGELDNMNGVQGMIELRESKCKRFELEVHNLKRPYITITHEQLQHLERGDCDFYLLADGKVVTFGNADLHPALMPLNQTRAREVLDSEISGWVRRARLESVGVRRSQRFEEEVQQLDYPYIPLDDEQAAMLRAQDTDYWTMPDGRLVTMGAYGNGWAVMPLKPAFAARMRKSELHRYLLEWMTSLRHAHTAA